MENHYFEMEEETFNREGAHLVAKALLGTLCSADMPNRWDMYAIRNYFCRNAAWCFPTVEWADSMAALCEGKKVLEIGAGNGLIAKLMRARGVDWVATDAAPPERVLSEVEYLRAGHAVDKYVDECDLVFWSWWPYEGSAEDLYAAENFLKRGKRVIVVGESGGGCTGSRDFWESDDIGINYRVPEIREDLPSWDGIHDHTHEVVNSGEEVW